MKKINKKVTTIFIIASLILVMPILVFSFIQNTRDLEFADTVIITDNQMPDGARNIKIKREDDEKLFRQIVDLCNSNKATVYESSEIPACMFERYEIEFKNGSKSVTVIPSDDDCDTMLRVSGSEEIYYNIDKTEKQRLYAILGSLNSD